LLLNLLAIVTSIEDAKKLI